jgi:hypothetical protein
MGTRALVHVKKDGRDSDTLLTVYRQFDGYPTGLGADIKGSLGGKAVVNGYNDPANQVNGMGCAAAMLVASIKDGCGSVYIYPADTSDVWEDYVYTLWAEGNALHIECSGRCEAPIFAGRLDDFDPEKAEQTAAA